MSGPCKCPYECADKGGCECSCHDAWRKQGTSSPDFGGMDADEIDYDKLDPGIREVVRWLNSKHFDTTDSGDGKYKLEHGWSAEEIVPMPHVYMKVPSHSAITEAKLLVRYLKEAGINVVAQTEAWGDFVDEEVVTGVGGAGLNMEQTDRWAKPYVEVLYDPVENVALMGLFNVTSDMIPKDPYAGD